MTSISKILAICICFSSIAAAGAFMEMEKQLVFYGMSDASAAEALDGKKIVCADDETNVLRVYDIDRPEKPAALVDLENFLRIDPEHPEADIEAAARVGDVIYWISSHGRNSSGKIRPARCALFATKIVNGTDGVSLKPVGKVYRNLLGDILGHGPCKELPLAESIKAPAGAGKKTLEKLAPKRDGINIEALCASSDGKSLYIGLRNPTVKTTIKGRSVKAAVVIELKRPSEIIKGAKAELGRVLLWDLGSLGLRSMDYSAPHKAYFIVGGQKDGSGQTRLYRWSGDFDSQPEFLCDIMTQAEGFAAEALITLPDSGKLMFLSDDGSREVKINSPEECIPGELTGKNRCRNKHLVDVSKRSFRAGIYTVNTQTN